MPTQSTPTASYPNIFDAGLPTLDYYDLADPEEVHHQIAQAREQAPIMLGPHGPECLTYELVRTMLRDDRFATVKGLGLDMQGISDGPLWDRVVKMMVCTDGEDHRRLRQLVSKAFSPRSVARLQSFIVNIITEILDPHVDVGHCDVVADISRKFPTPVICELIGAPRKDWQLFADWTDEVAKMFEHNVVEEAPNILAAWGAMDDYIEDMIASRRQARTQDIISELVIAENDEQISHSELLVMIMTFLAAGTDTTHNQLAAAVQILCDYPDQWALLAAHPELAPKAVDELMRHSPIFFHAPRVTTSDVALGDVMIPFGTVVTANLAAANRDPSVYDNPDKLDITRHSPAPMMAFGGGAHNCLGAHLARLELATALQVMPQRMPGLRRTGPAPWSNFAGVTGPVTLPVEFEPGH